MYIVLFHLEDEVPSMQFLLFQTLPFPSLYQLLNMITLHALNHKIHITYRGSYS